MNTTHVVSPAFHPLPALYLAMPVLHSVIPAQAGIHSYNSTWPEVKMDSRLRGNDTFYDGVTHDI